MVISGILFIIGLIGLAIAIYFFSVAIPEAMRNGLGEAESAMLFVSAILFILASVTLHYAARLAGVN